MVASFDGDALRDDATSSDAAIEALGARLAHLGAGGLRVDMLDGFASPLRAEALREYDAVLVAGSSPFREPVCARTTVV